MLIYCAINKINNKLYIGQTTKSLEERKSSHERCRPHVKHLPFTRAIIKYGKDVFIWVTLTIVDNRSDLNKKEKEWIKLLKTTDPVNGYNCACGGAGIILDGEREELRLNKIRKKIYQYSMDGLFIREFSCLTDATNILNLKLNMTGKISECANNKRKSFKNFRWSYIKAEHLENMTQWKGRSILQLTLSNEIIKTYESIRFAAESFKNKNIKSTCAFINDVCNGKQNSAYGFKWKYLEAQV